MTPVPHRVPVLAALLLGGMVRVAPASSATPGPSDRPLVLRAGTVLTGAGPAYRPGALLLLGGKITEVGHDVAVPPSARVLDFGDAAVLTPGFIDANNHLEYRGDRAAVSADLDPERLVAAADEQALDVARGGVTTVILQAYRSAPNGARLAAVKTAGTTRAGRVVDGLAGLRLDWPLDEDPLEMDGRIGKLLQTGKAYHEEWQKYFAALAKWQEEQAQGKSSKVAEKAEPKEASGIEQKDRSDPVSGRWEVRWETQRGASTAELVLQLTGKTVTGTFEGSFGRRRGGGGDAGPRPVQGTLEGRVLELEVDLDRFVMKLRATLDGETFTGTMQMGDRDPNPVTGRRVEKGVTQVLVVGRSRRRADGRPLPPALRPELEPFRRLFAGEIPLVLDVQAAIAMQHAVRRIVDEYALGLVLQNGGEFRRLPPADLAKVRGLLIPPEVRVVRGDSEVVPAQEAVSRGVRIAFQSDGETSGRGLGLLAAYAVHQGLSPAAALRALTLDAARMFQIDDRVGSLEAGKDADVLVFSGDPFELSSQLLAVFVNGEAVPERE